MKKLKVLHRQQLDEGKRNDIVAKISPSKHLSKINQFLVPDLNCPRQAIFISFELFFKN